MNLSDASSSRQPVVEILDPLLVDILRQQKLLIDRLKNRTQ